MTPSPEGRGPWPAARPPPLPRGEGDARVTELVGGGAPGAPIELRSSAGTATSSGRGPASPSTGTGTAPARRSSCSWSVSAGKRAQTELVRLAYHHPLTGPPNRAYLLDVLDQAIARARRTRTPMAALLPDVDRFEVVNDSLVTTPGTSCSVRAPPGGHGRARRGPGGPVRR
ncbi:diguanylate cyclase domain-containing protein [Blastococcus deserti]|uniref:Diguanylate cyclase domain-containing protein n=1 Tax=Blastococcus deserti TaxID=2259033 RepID=A0ABW4XE48_9ACTN